MLGPIIILLISILIGEFLIAYLFTRFTPSVLTVANSGVDWLSVFKGLLERMFLLIALFADYPHALTAFGALKIGTRLVPSENKVKVDEQDIANSTSHASIRKADNSYFLVGNLVSILMAIVYVLILKNRDAIYTYLLNELSC